MNKKLKKIIALVLASCLILGSTMTALAASNPTTITVGGSATGSSADYVSLKHTVSFNGDAVNFSSAANTTSAFTQTFRVVFQANVWAYYMSEAGAKVKLSKPVHYTWWATNHAWAPQYQYTLSIVDIRGVKYYPMYVFSVDDIKITSLFIKNGLGLTLTDTIDYIR